MRRPPGQPAGAIKAEMIYSGLFRLSEVNSTCHDFTLTIDNVEVLDSSLPGERIANIVAELNVKYAAQNVVL